MRSLWQKTMSLFLDVKSQLGVTDETWFGINLRDLWNAT